jgi:hypothetical protein
MSGCSGPSDLPSMIPDLGKYCFQFELLNCCWTSEAGAMIGSSPRAEKIIEHSIRVRDRSLSSGVRQLQNGCEKSSESKKKLRATTSVVAPRSIAVRWKLDR